VELLIYSANGLASLQIPEYNYRDKIPVPFDGNVTREYYTSSYLTGYSGEEFDFPASISRDIKGDLYNIYYASTGDKEGITNNRFYNLPNNDDPRTYFDSGIATNMDFSQLWTSQAPIEMYYSHPFTFLLPLPVARNKMIAVLVRGNLNYHLSQYRTAQVDCFLIGPSTVRQLQTPAALQQWGNSFQLPNYGPGTTAEAVTDDPLTWGKWGKLPSYSIAQGVGTRSLSPYNQNLPAYIAGVHTYENVWHVATAGTAQAMDTILGRPATYSPRWLELDKVPSTNSVTARLINTVDPQTGQPLNLSGGAKVPGISFPLSLSIPLSELEPPSDVYWRQLYLSGFKQSRVATQPRSVPFVAWDWGDPGYCRARLLELGFSEADLIP
jgi:hypothetical protein